MFVNCYVYIFIIVYIFINIFHVYIPCKSIVYMYICTYIYTCSCMDVSSSEAAMSPNEILLV